MRKLGLLAACILTSVFSTRDTPPSPVFPSEPPVTRPAAARKVPTVVYYDEELRAHHGEKLEETVEKLIALHNLRRERLLGEELAVEKMALLPSRDDKSAGSYFLNDLILRSEPEKQSIYLMGQRSYHFPGKDAANAYGFALNKGDALVVWAAVPIVDAALTLDHELYHCRGAHDLELPGAESTYSVGKMMRTFSIDVGNLRLIRSTPHSAARTGNCRHTFKTRIEYASRLFENEEAIRPFVENLLLEDLAVSNESYRQALSDVLRHGKEKRPGEFRRWIAKLERHPGGPALKQNAGSGAEYWAADAAYGRGDYLEAYARLDVAIRSYKGNDGRILAVFAAAEEEIAEKLTAASSSPRNR